MAEMLVEIVDLLPIDSLAAVGMRLVGGTASDRVDTRELTVDMIVGRRAGV